MSHWDFCLTSILIFFYDFFKWSGNCQKCILFQKNHHKALHRVDCHEKFIKLLQIERKKMFFFILDTMTGSYWIFMSFFFLHSIFLFLFKSHFISIELFISFCTFYLVAKRNFVKIFMSFELNEINFHKNLHKRKIENPCWCKKQPTAIQKKHTIELFPYQWNRWKNIFTSHPRDASRRE